MPVPLLCLWLGRARVARGLRGPTADCGAVRPSEGLGLLPSRCVRARACLARAGVAGGVGQFRLWPQLACGPKCSTRPAVLHSVNSWAVAQRDHGTAATPRCDVAVRRLMPVRHRRATSRPGVQVQRDTSPDLGSGGSGAPPGLLQCAQRQRCSAAWTDPAERVMPASASAARTRLTGSPSVQRSWWTRQAMRSRSASLSGRSRTCRPRRGGT
jgi:hypothetical protein